MAYRVQSSEKTASSAAEMETKALLHLLCEDGDKGEIRGFAIDFFNDVTGMDSNAFRLYDVQSKGEDSGSGALGEELVTLFKNYVSEFKDYFVEQILFVRKVTKPVLGNQVLSEFRYENLTDASKAELRRRLIEACKQKTYIDDASITDDNVDGFLANVIFVVSKKDKEDYIRPLIKTSNAFGTTPRDLRAIFNEIKKLQTGVKSSSKVEGCEVQYPSDVFTTGHVMMRKDIELLIIQRIINRNPLEAGIPVPFKSIYDALDEDIANDRLEACQDELALQMFAVNESAAFWALLGEIVTLIHNQPDADVGTIYHAIPEKILDACHQLTPLSHQYFIAIVKEGLKK